MERIKKLAQQFRKAIEKAKEAGEFMYDFSFSHFPSYCCGDTCYLLGQYLLKNGIYTFHVWGEYSDGNPDNYQTHAWLVAEDLSCIIDITADQFKNNSLFLNYKIPVYVDKADSFHDMFYVNERNVSKSCMLAEVNCLDNSRLPSLYEAIVKYIEE